MRAGWRLLLQAVLTVLFLGVFQLAASQIDGRNLQIVAGGIGVILAVWIAGIILDKRSISEFGLHPDGRWRNEFLAGFLIATLVMSLLVLIQWMIGWLEFTGFGWQRASEYHFVLALGGYVIAMAMVGFYEELWFRGYQLKNITEGLYDGKNPMIAGTLAIAITSLFFGLLHLGNPNATMLGAIVIILAGVMLAVPYVLTGRLGFSVGLHFAWNVIQGALYGLPVSGIRFRQSILQMEPVGPEIWTGGRFGPEGGLLGVIGVLLLITVSVLLLSLKGYPFTVSGKLISPPSSLKN